MKWLIKAMKSPVAMLVGIAVGFLTAFYAKGAVPYLKPLGTIYLNLLQMCVLPIVSCAVAVNIGALVSGKFKGLLGRWLLTAGITLLLSAGIALAVSCGAKNLIAPDEQTKLELAGLREAENPEASFFKEVSYYGEDESTENRGENFRVMDFVVNAIPNNIVTAFAENNTLKVLLFFGLFGVVLGLIDEHKVAAVRKGMEGIYQVFCRLIDGILTFLPLGLCVMIAIQFSQEGIAGIVVSLFQLIGLITVILLVLILLSFLVVQRSTKCSFREHLRAIKRTFFVAVGTSSCIATVSVAMDDVPEGLHLDKGVTRSIMPVGMTIFQSGVIVCAVVAAVFGSVLYNVDLGIHALVIIFVGTIMYSFSIVGIPGIVAVSMMDMFLSPLGIPSEMIVLIYLAIIPVIDPISVFASVYSNIAITAVVVSSKKRAKRKLARKFFFAMMGVSVTAVIVVSAASLFQFLGTKKRIVETRQAENMKLYESNVRIMTDSTRESLRVLTVGYAQGVSDNIAFIESAVSLIAMDIADLYENAAEGRGELPDGRVYLQPGVVWDEVNTEFAQVKGARELIDNAANIYQDASAIYYVSESGMLLSNVEVDYHSGKEEIDRRTRDWYIGAMQTGKVYWTEIYQDALSGEQALTCSCPVYDKEGVFRGVLAEDIYLDRICDAIFANSSELFEYSFIVDEKGKLLVEDGEQEYSGIQDRVQEILKSGGESAVKIYPKQQAVLGYAKIAVNGWSFFVLMDYDSIIRPAEYVGESIEKNNEQFLRFLDGKIRVVSLFFFLIAVGLVAVVLLVSSQLSRSIVRPVEELTDGVEKISTGNLDYPLCVKADGEIGELAAAFSKMTVDLREYVQNLEHVTAERERIGAELDIATNIQKSMLPRNFPAFPERSEIDIYATMEPAKEVGGDFYDFFMVDERHLAIVVADVSGKGVPAALFMVIGKTLIKDHTRPGCDLGEVFSEVNKLLCSANSEGLFITAFEGILDLATGEFDFVNAGHEIPFLCKRDGVFEAYPLKAGFVLAGMDGMKYKSGQLWLEPGDKIFQYTDGVTEATDGENRLYGMERLGEILAANAELPPQELLAQIKADIDAFVDKAPQFDDITMLCLEYRERMA